MTSENPEILVREKTKRVIACLKLGQLEEAKKIIESCKDTLNYNLGLVNFHSLIPRIRFSKIIPKTNDALKMVINTGFEIYSKEDNIEELVYFAAAKCDPDKLQYCVNRLLKENIGSINKTKEGDNLLMYLIKFGNIADENFLKCFEILLEAGIDVNKRDYYDHSPVIFLASLYRLYTSKTTTSDKVSYNLKTALDLLLKTQKIDINPFQIEELIKESKFDDLDDYFPRESATLGIDELFDLLIQKKEDEFIKNCKDNSNFLAYKDMDDGNNTLLQLCCEKNLKKVAKYLIENDVDVAKTTSRNRKPPIEIAARRNNQEIFTALLETDRIEISEKLFITFLQNRGRQIKSKYFDEILNYKNLDVNIKSSNGNTPLHYAIIFSNSDAVINLLQRGASLIIENETKKTPLDYISTEDLETYLDKCVLPDSYNDIYSAKYEIAFNFRSFVELDNDNLLSELSVIEKIANVEKLSGLINHPVVSSLLDLKWKISEKFYKNLLYFHILFYLITILSYFQLTLLHYLSVPLFMIYTAKIYTFRDWENNKIQDIVDSVLAFIILISNFPSNPTIQYQFGFLATFIMAMSFHLCWRFSPAFSELHATITVIVSHIISYLFYMGVIIGFFIAASALYFMFNDKNNIEGYKDIYFMLAVIIFFAALILMTLVSCFVSFQENGIDSIKSQFKVSGCKNVLIFLRLLEKLYFIAGDAFVPNPFIFEGVSLKKPEEKKESSSDKKKNKKKQKKDRNLFMVNFLPNLNKFLTDKLHSVHLQESNISRIKKMVKRSHK